MDPASAAISTVFVRLIMCARALAAPSCSASRSVASAEIMGMPALTRRSQDQHQECWQVYCGAVYVGTIVRRIGNPHDT
jgi:hypothetical protein